MRLIPIICSAVILGCQERPDLSYDEAPKNCSGQIEYLSSTDPAYEYLELKQDKIYKAFPGVQDPLSKAEMASPGSIKDWNDLIERLDEIGVVEKEFSDLLRESLECDKLNTRHESPLTHLAIKLSLDELKKNNPIWADKINTVRFGSLPTGKINGTALLPDGSDNPLIIIERDIYSFTGAFSKSISDAIPISTSQNFVQLDHSEEGIEKRILANPDILLNFSDALIRMIKYGTSKGARERFLDANHSLLHARLVSSMDEFIISHEVGHILLDHIETGKKSLVSHDVYLRSQTTKKINDELDLVLIDWDHNQELEADKIAVELMLAASDDNPIGDLVAVAAAEIIFELFDLIEIYKYQAGLPRQRHGQHPPASVRREALNKVVNEVIKKNTVLNNNADFRPVFTVSLNTLIKLADPIIREELGIDENESFPEEYQIRFK